MRLRFLPAALLALASLVAPSSAADWGQFRGPDGGVAADALPTEWAADTNIQWQAQVPGYGWSQPIVVGDKIFLTTAITENQQRPQVGGFGGRGPGGPGGFRREGGDKGDQGKAEPRAEGGKGPPPGKGDRPGPGGFGGQGPGGPGGPRGFGRGGGPPDAVYQWKVYCLDRRTGQILWEQLAHEGKPTIGIQPSNTYASQTPVSDGERVYAYFGMTGLFCFDLDGKLLWSKDLGSYPVMFGPGSSPALDSERVFVQCDNDEQSFLVALDKRTGAEVWRVAREEGSNYSTPYVWKNKLRTELVTSGNKVRSYDPATGKLLWEYGNLGGAVKPTPVGDENMLIVCTAGGGGGFGPGGLRLGGPGGPGGQPAGPPAGPGGAPPTGPGGFSGGPGGPGGGRTANSPLVAIKAGASGDISLSGT